MVAITVNEIKSHVVYDQETGSIRNASTGKLYGSASKSSYVSVYVKGSKIRGHIVAWVMVNNEYPEKHIDHINGIMSDNRITNLRSVSHADNMKNKKKYKNNSTGVPGVYFDKDNGKYRARLGHGKNAIHVGRFSTIEMAKNAIEIARKENGYIR